MEEKTFFNGRWKVVEEIGKGTTGTVYKVLNSRGGVNSYAAIKEILLPKEKKEILNMYSQGATDSDITEYFENKANEWIAKEVNFLEQFKGNPNIVSIEDHDVLEREDMLGRIVVIRMELLETLEDYVLNHEVTDKEMIKMGLSILNALVDCEERNVLHRDIKPQNVFVNKNKIFKLGDFSESKEIEKTVSNMTQRGTPNYMAPELYKGERGSKSIDTYSLGIMLYQYFNNNRLPFMPDKYKFEDAQKVLERRMNGDELPAPKNASSELSKIILKACSYKPEDRYQSAMDFKEDLQRVYDDIKTPKVLLKNSNQIASGNSLEESKSKDGLSTDKTVGIYSDSKDNSSKKNTKGKSQFGESLEVKPKETKKESTSSKKEVVSEKTETPRKNYNETVGIFYESQENTVKKEKTAKKKQFGTKDEIEEEEIEEKEKPTENKKDNTSTILSDTIYKTEPKVIYHKVKDLYYIVPNYFSSESSDTMYLYDYFKFIYYSVLAVPYNNLSNNVKNEEDFVKANYADIFDYQLLSKDLININDVIWHSFTYKDGNMIRDFYIKKIGDICYICKIAYKNYDGALQQVFQKYINTFSLYVLNYLVFDKCLSISDKNKSGASKLREIQQPAIADLESYFDRLKNPKKSHDGLWWFWWIVMVISILIAIFTGLFPLAVVLFIVAAYMMNKCE